MLSAHVDADHRPYRWQRLHINICTAQSYEVFSTWGPADGCGQNTPLYKLTDSAFYISQLRELHSAFQYFDICANALALIALPMVSFAFEFWVSGFLTFFDPPKEILIGRI